MKVWEDILNYPIIDTRSNVLSDSTKQEILDNAELSSLIDLDQTEGFIFSPINLIVFLIIFLLTKFFLKYLKRYFKALHIDEKQFKIEGREFTLWRLIKQIMYFLMFYLMFQSLNINNYNINLSSILVYDFIRIGTFHIAVYHLFLIIVVLFLAKLSVNFLKLYLLKRVAKRTHIDRGTEYIIIQIAKYIIYTLSIIVILRSFGIGLDLLLGGATALLVGFGLGVQDIFKDFMSGFLLLFEGTTKVGDVVELNNLSGTVEDNFVATITEINLRTTKVKTREGKTLIVPNSILTHQMVNNWTYDDKLTRFTIKVTVAYGTDLDLVKQILIKCAQEHPKVKNTKPIFVRLLDFGNNGLEMDLVFWADQNFYIEIYKSEIRFTINKEFEKYGVVIPFPQQDVRIKNLKDINHKI
ncbi:MAG TPA: mechanosensitive ion channel [Crocinitomix sp.]|nr:mechanosensitive ion channel [Crocinitomix sp.]